MLHYPTLGSFGVVYTFQRRLFAVGSDTVHIGQIDLTFYNTELIKATIAVSHHGLATKQRHALLGIASDTPDANYLSPRVTFRCPRHISSRKLQLL
jgi:hypothetical protein